MQSVMNITVRVRGARAAQGQLAGVAASTRAVSTSAAAGAAAQAGMMGGLARSAAGLQKYGKNMQWVGRQIEFNFTLPIALATGMATKWAMETERAMTRMRKVYFDSSRSAEEITDEINKLGQAFRMLSDRFGVAQDEVVRIGARWAQAGARGAAVARGTHATMELMILGSMEAAEAVDSLITMQMQYKLSTEELQYAVAELNAIENETAAALPGLIQGFQRAGGQARAAGVEVRELGAMLAAIVPAYANATQAGNSLRTIMSRIMAPTNQMNEVMREIGLEIDNTAWHSKNFTERLHDIEGALSGLTKSQYNYAISVIAGRRQVARFAGLLEAVTDESGMYQKALRATADEQEVMARYQHEINEVLTSDPMLFQRMANQLKNLAQEIVQPLIPALIGMLAQFRKMMAWFSNLSPQIQSFTLFMLLALAVLGPFIRTFGAMVLLSSVFIAAFAKVGTAVVWVMTKFKALFIFLKSGDALVWLGLRWQATMGFLAKTTGDTLAWIALRFEALKLFVISRFLIIKAAVVSLTQTMYLHFLTMVTWIKTTMIPAFAAYARAVVAAMITSTKAVVAAVATKLVALKTLLLPAFAAIAAGAKAAAGSVVIAFKALGAWLATLFAPLIAGVAKGLAVTLGVAAKAVVGLAVSAVAAVGAVTSPVWLIVAAVAAVLIGAVLLFTRYRDGTMQVVGQIRDGLYKLPEVFIAVFKAIVNIVKTAAMVVYENMQRLNPFKRFSPSLVESVRDGIRIIVREYAALSSISSTFDNAVASLERFKAATAHARSQMRGMELSEKRSNVAQVSPGSVPAFDHLARSIVALEGALDRVGRAFARQEAVVARLRRQLDAVNDAIRRQRDVLQGLERQLATTQEAIRRTEEALSSLANMPIEGMREFDDALFDNEQAQKRLRLEILKLEEAHGPVDDLRDKMARLQGDIERMIGKREDLRLSGAGSEITGMYDKQVDEMRAAQRALMDAEGAAGGGGPSSEVDKLTEELEKLRREAEMMQLERDLQFDPLTRQIHDLINGYEEMPFKKILANIKKEQAELARLTTLYERQEKAVDQQKALIHALELRAGVISRVYDEENRKLSMLRDTYQGLQSTLREMQTALDDFARSAADAVRKAEAAKKAAEDALKDGPKGPQWLEDFKNSIGDFDVPGGESGIGWEDGLDDLLEDWSKWAEDEFGDFNIWEIIKKPFKDMWNSVRNWFSDRWDDTKRIARNAWDSIKEGWGSFWSSVSDTASGWWASISEGWGNFWDGVGEKASEIWDGIKEGWGTFWEGVKEPFQRAREWIRERWDAFWNTEIGEELRLTLDQWSEWISTAWENIKSGLSSAWQWVKDRLSDIWEGITEKAQEEWENVEENVIDPIRRARDWLVRTWDNFTDWIGRKWNSIKDKASEIWNGVKDVVEEPMNRLRRNLMILWDRLTGWLSDKWNNIKNRATAIWNSVKLYFKVAWDNIKEIFRGAWKFIEGIIIAGLRFLRGDISGGMDKIREIIGKAWERVRNTTRNVWNNVRDAINDAVERIKTSVSNARDAIGRIWDGIKSRMRRPIAAAVNVAVNPFINGVNRILRRVGISEISRVTVPQFHKGGEVGGSGGEPRNLARKPLGADEIFAVLKRGERVLTPQEAAIYQGDPGSMLPEVGGPLTWAKNVASGVASRVRETIGEVVRPAIRAALRAVESIPGADTLMGQIGVGVARTAGNGIIDWLKGAEDQMPKAAELSGGGRGPGYQAMFAAVKEQFPWARLTSGLRPGAITATGNPSYHAQGRAVDLAGRGFMNHSDMLQINRWIADNYQAQTKELIYSGIGARQLHNGRPHFYSGITRQMHFDHVHWAMDKGGMLQPGWNQPIFNGTGRPEIVTPERLMRRIVREEVQMSTKGGDTHISINGDLSFPNITDGTDAEKFINNIESMVD